MATTQTNKTPVKTSSSDEKAYQNALLNDPRLDCWKKVVLNCCILITILGNTSPALFAPTLTTDPFR